MSASIHTDLLALDQSKTFYKPDWFDIVGAEVKCCKEAVCVIDMSSFTKFELTVSPFSPDSLYCDESVVSLWKK